MDNLLFLNNFSHFVEKPHLLINFLIFVFFVVLFPAPVPPENPLHEPARIQYFLEIPLNLKHPPVLLNGNSRIPLLHPILLRLSTLSIIHPQFTSSLSSKCQ